MFLHANIGFAGSVVFLEAVDSVDEVFAEQQSDDHPFLQLCSFYFLVGLTDSSIFDAQINDPCGLETRWFQVDPPPEVPRYRDTCFNFIGAFDVSFPTPSTHGRCRSVRVTRFAARDTVHARRWMKVQ